jgi:serine/threonine-protein kinase HipA
VCVEPRKRAYRLFGRMVFNALISNIDDHLRNRAAIAEERIWKLSRVYDLASATPMSGERRELAVACGEFGR